MARFKPTAPFSTPMKILIPSYQTTKGVRTPVYPEPDDLPDATFLFFGNVRSFLGSITTENDLSVSENTAYIDTWYRPDIRSNCRVYFCETGDVYEVIGEPEDIEMRHQYLRIRTRKIGGAA